MKRRAKVELFEEIRREYEFGIGTVRGVARKLGVGRVNYFCRRLASHETVTQT